MRRSAQSSVSQKRHATARSYTQPVLPVGNGAPRLCRLPDAHERSKVNLKPWIPGPVAASACTDVVAGFEQRQENRNLIPALLCAACGDGADRLGGAPECRARVSVKRERMRMVCRRHGIAARRTRLQGPSETERRYGNPLSVGGKIGTAPGTGRALLAGAGWPVKIKNRKTEGDREPWQNVHRGLCSVVKHEVSRGVQG